MLKPTSEHSFFRNNIILIFIVTVCSILGADNNTFLILSVVTVIFAMAISPFDHKFCWSIFLVPNIRIFDNLGSTSIVNMLFIIPLIFYFIRSPYKIKGWPLFAALILFCLEDFHKIGYEESILDLIGWILAFLSCVYITLDDEIEINTNDLSYALTLGTLVSFIACLMTDSFWTSDLIQNTIAGYRFEGFASDPNAYSAYLCIALASLAIKPNMKVLDYLMMGALMVLGILTGSKMCILLMIIIISYFIVVTSNSGIKISRNIVIIFTIVFIAYLNKDFLLEIFDNMYTRSGGDQMTLNTLTTNRYDIQMEYLHVLGNDFVTLFFGRGFSYYYHLDTYHMHQAHNTYMDIVLSWGLIGTILFTAIISVWFMYFKKKTNTHKYMTISKLPLIVLLISFFSLSLFDAGMFYFVISYCMLQLRPANKTIVESENIYDY